MIDVDYHPSFEQIAFLMEETGEYSERRVRLGLAAALWVCRIEERFEGFNGGLMPKSSFGKDATRESLHAL
jgi:hypothetical protein